MNSTAVLLFTRIPVAGRTKTRLLPALSGEQCAALQRAMTLDALDTLLLPDWDLFLCYSDDGPLSLLGPLPEGLPTLPQEGEGLGLRMHHALCHTLRLGYTRCLLLGSDLPFLTSQEVQAAADLLLDHQVTLCPSEDGGYWLVGLRAPFPELFDRQPYGTGTVLEDALAVCAQQGRTVGLGPCRRDLDTPNDLEWFRHRLRQGTVPHHSRTALALTIREERWGGN